MLGIDERDVALDASDTVTSAGNAEYLIKKQSCISDSSGHGHPDCRC